MVLAACGGDKEGSDKVNDNESSKEIDNKENGNEETDAFLSSRGNRGNNKQNV